MTAAAALRRGLTYAAVIVVNAGAQAALVAIAPAEPLTPSALALAAVSGVILLATAIALWALATRALSRWIIVSVPASSLGVAVVGIALPAAASLAIAVGCLFTAAGSATGLKELLRHRPGRVVILLVLTIVTVLLTQVIALLLGLLVTGPAAAFVAWMVFGLATAALVMAWSKASQAVADSPANA